MEEDLGTSLLKLHPNKVPIIIDYPESSNISLKKRKYIVPNDMTLRQFHCYLSNLIEIKSKDSIIMFIDNKLPLLTSTIGSAYDEFKVNNFLYISIQKENTFG